MAEDKFYRWMKIAMVIVLLLVVVVLAVVVGLVWSMPDLPTTSADNQICLATEHGGLRCGKTHEMLHDFLDKSMKEHYEAKKASAEEKQRNMMKDFGVKLQSLMNKYYMDMKPAAKITGTDLGNTMQENKTSDLSTIRVWKHGRDLRDTYGFERFGIRYRNGRLVVPVTGTYFVYSLLDVFEPLDQSTGQPYIKDSNRPIKHGIFKFNILEGEEKEVTSAVQPHTISSNNLFNAYSSYISTLVDLKAGDELSVKFSNLTYLRYPRDNTFGVNFIS